MQFWSGLLTAIPALIAVALWRGAAHPGVTVAVGLAVFGVVFAMNSSIHSYMILAYTEAEDVSLNVGFYYMANAAGRLLGTVLSGALFLVGGLPACLWCSALLVGLSFAVSTTLPSPPRQQHAAG